MRHFLTGVVILISMATAARAQKIETEAPIRDRIVHVHTALNHLTVIEVGEPVLSVAAGSSAFKIEWRDNKVFVEPTAPNVSTNLFIWTASSRFNYELSPAGAVEGMDFAIDHPWSAPAPKTAKPATEAEPPKTSSHIDSMVQDKMVRHERELPSSDGRVTLRIDDLFEDKGVVFVRYEIRNTTHTAYSPKAPKVFLLAGVRSPLSLVGREGSQLSEGEAHKLRIGSRIALETVAAKPPAKTLAPGDSSVGVLGLTQPESSSEPRVLRFELPSDGGHSEVTAILVL